MNPHKYIDVEESEDVTKRFDSTEPDHGQLDRIGQLRGAYKAIAEIIEEACYDSREKSIALTKLEESSMWAIKSVTHNG